MKDVDKAHFLDAQAGLFGDTVEGFAQQFSAVQQQIEAIQHTCPGVMHHPPLPPGPGLSLPVSCVLQSCSATGRIDTLAGASSHSQESGAPRVPVLNCLSSFRGRNVVPLKQFQRLLGHMASAAAVTPLGLLHMRPLQHWLHSQVPLAHPDLVSRTNFPRDSTSLGAAAAPTATSGRAAAGPFFLLLWLRVIGGLGSLFVNRSDTNSEETLK